MNNHNLFGMFLTVRGHPFSRADRRLAFFCQCCLALWIAVMFRQSSLNSVQQAAVKLFFISPMAVMINKYIYYMLSCPCLRNMKEHGGSRKYFAMCCEGFGKFAVLPSLALYLTALVVAAIYTPEQEEAPALLIAKFAYSIIIVTAFYECVYAYKHFITGRWYWELRICNICVFTLGKFFHEKIQHGFFLQPHQFVRQEGGCRGMISWVIEKQIIGTFEPETSTLIATSNEAVSSPTSSSEVPMEDENLEHNVANESKVDSTIVAQNVDVIAI